MRAIYNGVDLMPITTHEFNIEPVYDDSGVDYLFSRGTYLGESVVSPFLKSVNGPAMSYVPVSQAGPSGINPGGLFRKNPGFTPAPFPAEGAGVDAGLLLSGPVSIAIEENEAPLTHQTIRYRLTSPRQQLFLFHGPGMESGSPQPGTDGEPENVLATILLAAPSPGDLVDCNNGPRPRLFNVIRDSGDGNSYIVTWGCEFFINEAESNFINPFSALVSNRFKQTHHVDDHGWTSIRTEGTALFRTDLLYAGLTDDVGNSSGLDFSGVFVPSLNQAFSPDNLRAALFLPIPQGFTREIESVEGLESVAGVRYAYVDTQEKVNFVGGPFANPDLPGTGAAEITVLHRQSLTTNADVLGGALSAYERILGIRANKAIAKEDRKRPRVPARIGIPGRRPPVVPGAPAAPPAAPPP